MPRAVNVYECTRARSAAPTSAVVALLPAPHPPNHVAVMAHWAAIACMASAGACKRQSLRRRDDHRLTPPHATARQHAQRTAVFTRNQYGIPKYVSSSLSMHINSFRSLPLHTLKCEIRRSSSSFNRPPLHGKLPTMPPPAALLAV